MAKWEQLVAAREQKHLSQWEAAEHVNVGVVTYQRWEAGKARPQPQHMRQLYAVFGTLLASEKEALARGMHSSEQQSFSSPLSTASTVGEVPTIVSGEHIDEPEAFIAAHLTPALWSLAFKDHLTCTEKQTKIRQCIKDFDSMNTDNKNYQITRREALCSLATLPIMTLGLTTAGRSVPTSQYGSAIAHCSASLEACWKLRESSFPSETALAFQCSSKYLSVLQVIMKDSPTYREAALDLATRYALVKTRLGWGCVGPTETVQYAKEAVELSKETGDISLQLSAYSKLAWTYLYLKKDGLALKTAQEADALLTRYVLSPSAQPLHPCILGGTYSTFALMQAKNGQAPDIALGKALETDPEDSYAFMTTTRSQLLLEAGWTHCYSGNQVQAMELLEMRVDPETLMPRLAQTPTLRVETINAMALSSLRTKDRDMEKTIHFWEAGIEGAKTLQNEQRFTEALTNYELMDAIWSGEPHIADLRDHIVHWKE